MKIVKHTAYFSILLLALTVVLAACTKNVYVDKVIVKPPECKGKERFSAMKKPRHGMGLALSGGGYRATLFHLGALRRLNELGLLHQFDEISSVSGGSLTSAQLASFIAENGGNLQEPISVRDWEKKIVQPLYTLTAKDIRTKPLLMRYLLPWNWPRSTAAIDALAERIENDVTSLMLRELPQRPDFVFSATDLGFGVNWEMRRWRMGSYQSGYLMPPPDNWSVGQAVAASAAFPPVFQPMKVEEDSQNYKVYYIRGRYDPNKPEWDQDFAEYDPQCWKPGNWQDAIDDIRLSDGGVYDNIGMEPIWKDRQVVFISDGGMALSAQPDQGFFWRVLRWQGIVTEQSRALRKRLLFATTRQKEADRLERAIYWSIGNSRSDYLREGDEPGYSKILAHNFLGYIRTDLDGFSEAERAVLENHGYLVADAAVRAFGRKLVEIQPWPELKVPHPAWLPPKISECDIMKALVQGYHECDSAAKQGQ